MFSRSNELLGVDIGSSSIKVVGLKYHKGVYELVNFRMVPLPSETIVDGSIMNSTAVVDALSEIVSLEKIKSRGVVTSVCGHSVIVKKIKLPQMSDEELEESIQWEAEQYIPFDITDVNLDVQILRSELEDDIDQMEVLLVAAKKDMINDHVAVLTEAGLSPQVMDIDAFAIGNMFQLNYVMGQDEVVALINIGAAITNVNILGDGGLSVFTRDISIGGSQYTEEIQKQLGVAYEEAEALKLGGHGSGNVGQTDAVIPQEVGGILRSVSENIAVEVQRSLDFYFSTTMSDRIDRICLMGGSSRVPGLASAIETKTGVKTEVVNPFKEIRIDQTKFDLRQIEEVAPLAAVAVGLALRKVGDR